MRTIDRDSLERGPVPLVATLGTTYRKGMAAQFFGMHLNPVQETLTSESTIALGNKVEVLEVDEERNAEWERLFL